MGRRPRREIAQTRNELDKVLMESIHIPKVVEHELNLNDYQRFVVWDNFYALRLRSYS